MFWFIMKMCYMTINDIKKAVLYYIIKKNTKKTKRYRISTLENCVSQTNTISFQLHTSNETKMLTTKCKLMILQSFVSFRQYFYLNKNAENITKSSITQNLETLMYTTRGVLLNVCNLFSRTSKYQFYEQHFIYFFELSFSKFYPQNLISFTNGVPQAEIIVQLCKILG